MGGTCPAFVEEEKWNEKELEKMLKRPVHPHMGPLKQCETS